MARMKEISGKIGISIEVKDAQGRGTWYRPELGAVIELDATDTPAKRKQVVTKLVEFIMEGLNSQIDQIVNGGQNNNNA